MKIEKFELERFQSLWENRVTFNLTESGVHPLTIQELLNDAEIKNLLNKRIGYGQTNGSIPLRETISRLYPGVGAENILVTNGSAEANFIAMWSLLESKDEVLFMIPNYMQMWGIVRSFGAGIKSFHLKEELNWKPDLEEIPSQITSKTKMIVICNPNNPTGAILSEEEMKRIVDIAEKNNIWIYADEVYRGAELEGNECPSFLNLRNSYDKVIVTGGLSKSYALPGLRIGWLAGPEDIIANVWSHHDYTTIAPGILSDYIATVILHPENRRKVLQRSRDLINKNLEILIEWIGQHQGLFFLVPPKAGAMAFIRYSLDINSTKLAEKLRNDKSVLIIPGDFFGMDGYIRLGIGSEKEYFLRGLALIEDELNPIMKKES